MPVVTRQTSLAFYGQTDQKVPYAFSWLRMDRLLCYELLKKALTTKLSLPPKKMQESE